jgi:superfamily II DNA or RNA helicase
MITLYDYQHEAVKNIRKLLKDNRVLFQLSTGGGKTIIFSYISQQVTKKNKRVLIISHRVELLAQAGGTLEEFGMQPQLITAKTRNPRDASVSVAMVGTLKNRLKKDDWKIWFNKIDLLIIDECHRSEFSYLDKPHCFKLGVTATPKRSGKMPQLYHEYDVIIFGPDVQELIHKKRLMPDKYFGVPIDLSGIGKDNKGEYNTSELFDRYNKKVLYQGLIDNWKKHTPRTQSICFCCNIQHCVETAKQLNAAGIGAKFVTSAPNKPKEPETDNKGSWTLYERKKREYENYQEYYSIYSGPRGEIINEWKNNEFYILINAGILIEGFDNKPTQTVILNLATTSENKYLQMIGRGSRPSPETNKMYFNILDFGENAVRLGYYRQQREYSLSHSESNGNGVPPSKECPKCHALVLASSQICKYCGFEFPKSKEEKIAELVEHKYSDKNAREIDASKMTIDELEEYTSQKGYKKAWLWRQIYFAHGEDTLKAYAKKNGYHWSWAKRIIDRYEK